MSSNSSNYAFNTTFSALAIDQLIKLFILLCTEKNFKELFTVLRKTLDKTTFKCL